MTGSRDRFRLRRALGAALVLALGTTGAAACGGGDDGGYDMAVYFPRAVALYPGGQVRVLGLPAGSVRSVEVEGTRVRVELHMSPDVAIPSDARAIMIPQSLIGERYVQLTPAWTPDLGRTMAEMPEDQRVIEDDGDDTNGREVTIPVEPDETLAAVNEFLDSLNPQGLGRLVNNLSVALDGNGEQLGVALSSIADLVDTFASRDDELAAILDNFDGFTQTLVTRESQLGEIIDSFSRTARLLADERFDLESLLSGLARVSADGFDLVAEHAGTLRQDIDTLSRLGQSIVTNLDSVEQLLDAGPLLVAGLDAAYNPTLRAMNLRTQLGPLAQQILNPVLRGLLGDPDFNLPCLAIDTDCGDGSLLGGLDASAPVATDIAPARSPIDDVLDSLGGPLAPLAPTGPGARPAPSVGDRVADGAGSLGSFLRRSFEDLVGVAS